MQYTKEIPTVEGFYWVKWGDYAGFVEKLYILGSEVYLISPIDGKTKVLLSDDENYWYSSQPLSEPK